MWLAQQIFLCLFFHLQSGLLFAAISLPVIALFGGVAIIKKDANIFFHWIFEICFLKYAGDASASTIFGYNRTKMICDDTVYCHFQHPNKFLSTVGLDDIVTFNAIFVLILSLIFFRVVAFIMMNYRLKHWTNNIQPKTVIQDSGAS